MRIMQNILAPPALWHVNFLKRKKSLNRFSITLFDFPAFPAMKRSLIFVCVTLLLGSISYAQQSSPAAPPFEPQVPPPAGPARSASPAQAIVPVPVPIAPPKPNGPVQKSLVRI